MKRSLFVATLIVVLGLCFNSFADDDDKKYKSRYKPSIVVAPKPPAKPVLEFYYTIDVVKGGLDSGRFYVMPSGKVYLVPNWAVPTPPPTPEPPPTPPPVILPTSGNAIKESCARCHKQTESKFQFANWTDSLHDKTAHRSRVCSTCHKLD